MAVDHGSIKRLGDTLDDIRTRYGDARTVVRGLRAREATDVEMAYWIGVAQSFSKQAADDLQALQDAIDRLELMTRQKTESAA
jgi:hypothetical protein